MESPADTPSRRFKISVQPTDDGVPRVDAEIGRINVILGVNGSGKTRLLTSLEKKGAFPADKVYPVYGRRTWAAPDIIGEGGRPLNTAMPRPLTSEAVLRGGRSIPIDAGRSMRSRPNQILSALMTGRISDTEFHIALGKWVQNNQQGPKPEQGEYKIRKLFEMFNKVFPSIQLDIEEEDPNKTFKMHCVKDGRKYRPSQLSDGEKETLCLQADLVFASHEDSIFLVDEPELHLHPGLAQSFWESIEQYRPKGTFVYATHSLPFAMRDVVDTRIVLSAPGEAAVVVESFDDLPREDLRDFLGAIPSILKSGKALATEGKDEQAFDAAFYSWVLGRPDIAVVQLQGNGSVQAATKHTGIWRQLAPSVAIRGVIDRDYRSKNELDDVDAKCTVLKFHAAESYICYPRMVVDLARALRLKRIPTEEDVLGMIVEYCRKLRTDTALKRYNNRQLFQITESVSPGNLQDLDDATVIEKLKKHVDSEIVRLRNITSFGVEKACRQEMAVCDKALNDRDADLLLSTFKMKGFAATTLPGILGVESDQVVLNGTIEHLRLENYPPMVELRESLRRQWCN